MIFLMEWRDATKALHKVFKLLLIVFCWGLLSPGNSASSETETAALLGQILESKKTGSKTVPLELKRKFLSSLGVHLKKLSKKEIDLLYRGLLSLPEDYPKIRTQVGQLKDQKSAHAILENLFGRSVEVKGVLVLSLSEVSEKNLRKLLKTICSDLSPCPFWDSRVLLKVLITSESGLAAFIPELGILILSKLLLEKRSLLHSLVVLHELSHSAILQKKVYEKIDWVKEFSSLSKWQEGASGQWTAEVTLQSGQRKDQLTEESKNSPFSLLPDPIYLGKTSEIDGFAMGKAYLESVKHKDPSEDLADHLALYRLYPGRFCYKGRNIAPKKFAWISQQAVFPLPQLSCGGKP